MFQLSSSTTLFWKIFLPCFWAAFLGGFIVGSFLLDEPYMLGFPILWFRLFLIAILSLSLMYFKYSTLDLKRIDANEEHLFVSSYFKNYRYSYESIEKIALKKKNGKRAALTFVETSSFGKEIPFLMSIRNVKKFLEAYPEKWEIFDWTTMPDSMQNKNA
jgi:hypothetical protein